MGSTASGNRHPARLTVASDLTGLLAVEYGRKSTPDPRNPGKSVEDQLGELDEECRRRGLIVAARLDDPTKGASKYSKAKVREAFETIIQMIESQPIAVLAVWELSRATRRLKIFGDLMELCEDRNVLILLRDRLYDPRDHRDRMTLGIRAVMDENEVALGRERTLRGVASAAAMGLPHGPHLYGYQRVYDQRTGALVRVELEPEQADIVREIARRVLDGEASRAIARDLNAREVRRPRGGTWHPGEIRDILTNPAYAGRRLHVTSETGEAAEYDAIWPAILTPDDVTELGRIFRERSRGGHTTNPKYLLTGVVVCGRCDDRPMYVQAGRAARPGDRTSPAAYQCPGCKRTRNQAALERYVLDVMEQWLSSPAFREAELADIRSDSDPDAAEGRRRLDDARRELEEAEADLAAGEISPRAFTVTERRLAPLIEGLERSLDVADEKPSAMAEYLAAGGGPLADMTLAERRETIKSFIRVRCLASRRGRGFHPESVQLIRT
jgi:site-specific DNA recombinase